MTSKSNKQDPPELTYRQISLVLFGTGVGSLLEFFCFGLVGYFRQELFLAYFPPSSSSLLKSFILFGIAFAFRPFGGLFYGYIGDKYGRIFSFRISLACMTLSSFLFAFIPNYSSIGYWATALAFILRSIQGFSVGGEMSTALVYIMEVAPKRIRGLLIGILWSLSMGSLFSLLVYVVWDNTSSNYSSSSWTWRIPFACTIFIGIFGQFLRNFMPVSLEFKQLTDRNLISENPLWTAFQLYPKEIVILLFAYTFPPMAFYGIVIWVPAYLQSKYHQSIDDNSYNILFIAGILLAIQNTFGGYLSDKYGNYFCVKYGMICFIPFMFANWTIMSLSSNSIIISVCQILLSSLGCVSSTIVIWCVSFVKDARIRNTVTGFTYNMGMAVFVSTLMEVLTALAEIDVKFGGMIAALYICMFGAMCLLAIMYGENRIKYESLDVSIDDEDVNENENMEEEKIPMVQIPSD